MQIELPIRTWSEPNVRAHWAARARRAKTQRKVARAYARAALGAAGPPRGPMGVTLTRVAKDKALPFELKVPNAETRAAIEESRAMMKARRARFNDGQELFDALDQETRQ